MLNSPIDWRSSDITSDKKVLVVVDNAGLRYRVKLYYII